MADPPGRVLLVDDSEDDHLQIRRILGDKVVVIPAFTAEAALERLDSESFDVMITDQKMPRMSGDTLIVKVKSQPHTANLRCILLSGKTSDHQLVGILRVGHIYRYFEKNQTLLTPEGRSELRLAVRNAVAASRLVADRQRLTERLRTQVDAVQAQYRLLRSLVAERDPNRLIAAVVDSLAERVGCRGVIGLVDLRPESPSVVHVASAPDVTLPQAEIDTWVAHTQAKYSTLSGRQLETTSSLDHSQINPDAPSLPVFLNRDLRGVLMIINEAPLAPDEAELFEVWRDQLQDALTQAYTQRLDEQRRIELMLETMAEGVVLTDENGAVTLANPAARNMLRLSAVDRADFAVVVSALGLSSLEVLRQLAGDNAVRWRELQLGDAYYHVLFSSVRDHAGRFVGILTVMRDVSAERLAAHRREEFVHIIGHELRSPLTSIGGVLDLLMRQVLGDLTTRQHEYLHMAKDSCVRINHIINDLLDLAKFEQGKMPLALTSVSLETVVAENTRKFEPVALERKIDLRFECELEGLVLQADSHRLGQVMSNLIANALKFTPDKGAVSVSVFTAYIAPDHYLVAIHNVGEEIQEADLDRIFDKFEQVAVQDRRSVGGTGLGLSICRNIIRGHHGQIWVESGRGQGTTFIFSLPYYEPSPVASAGVPTSAGSRKADGSPILVVSEDEQEGWALKARLLAFGFLVRVCGTDGAQVRERIETQRPALAIYLDVFGSVDTAVLHELASHNDLPLVALLPPGTPVPPTVDLMLELPTDSVVLSSALHVVLEQARSRRRLRLLIVDHDLKARQPFIDRLDEAGYLAYGADSTEVAIRRNATLLPDLLIVDMGLPHVDRLLEAVHEQVPVLYTHAADIAGLPAENLLNADADPQVLLVQIRVALARGRREGIGAMMLLPGARELQREIQQRMKSKQPYAFCAVDILGLREGIEHLGFMWGHAAMAQIAQVVQQVLAEHADERAFLGHQRDDDFVFLVGPEHCDTTCREIVRAFEGIESLIRGSEAIDPLKLSLTAIVDEAGRFDRYAALQAELSQARLKNTGDQLALTF